MQRQRFPNDLNVFHLHRGECVYLYDEVFRRRCYAMHGITLEPGRGCVFDVGANIGMAALFFHAECPGIKVYSFEPNPLAYEALTANLTHHGVNGTAFKCGISHSKGAATLTTYPEKPCMSSLFPNPGEDMKASKSYLMNQMAGQDVSEQDVDSILASAFRSEQVQCELRSVSEIIATENVEQIQLLKIDVERAELDVLDGIEDRHWEAIRQVVVEVHAIENRVDEVVTRLTRRGFGVVSEQDPLLVGTELFNIYARRS